MKGRLWKIIVTSVIVILSIVLVIVLTPTNESIRAKVEGNNILSLIRPPFATAASEGTNFLDEEAGISAYTNVGKQIDLDDARDALIGISSEGESYIIGNVELEGLPEEEFPLVYIHADGWILTYYTKYAPASRIMQWHDYDGGACTKTTLEDAIAVICPHIGVNYLQIQGSIEFYDFKYPNATTVVLAVDSIDDDGTDTFNFEIPFNVTLYESSWSHYAYDSCDSYTKIDDVEINNFTGTGCDEYLLSCAFYEEVNLIAGVKHTVSIYHCEAGGMCGWAGIAVVFLYSGT